MIEEIKTPFGKLAAEVKTTYHIDWLTYSYHRDAGRVGLDDIFKAAYGKSLDIESGNDMDYSYSITKEPLDEYELETIEECVAAGSFEDYNLPLFLQDLVNKNILPAGHYVIGVSW